LPDLAQHPVLPLRPELAADLRALHGLADDDTALAQQVFCPAR
jgi:hypothetical protein